MLETIITQVTSQAGLVSLLLLGALVYMSRRVQEERKERIDAQTKLFEQSVKQIEANNATTNSLDQLIKLIERSRKTMA